jgi:NitT/TauT family transport system substrate-binding protein
MSPRALWPLSALVVSLLLVLGCGRRAPRSEAGASSAPGAAHVTLALDWVPEPEFGGFYAGREGGAFAAEGIDLEIQGGGAGAPVVQRVATGQVDFGVIGGDEVVIARARGADVVPVFATYQTSPQGIMVHASRGLADLRAALRTGTIALEPGLPYAAFLRKKYGFAGATIVPYDGGVARFLADPNASQQCFVTSEPLAARRKGGDPKVFLVADEGYDPYAGVVVTRRALFAERPELVRAFVRASRDGWKRYLADPRAANAVIARLNPGMDAETFASAADAQRALVETAETKARGLGTMSRERWEALGRQLVELGFVERAPSADELLVPID